MFVYGTFTWSSAGHVCPSPRAAVTNHQKPAGFRQQQWILSRSSRPETQNWFYWLEIKVHLGLLPQHPEGSGESLPATSSVGDCRNTYACVPFPLTSAPWSYYYDFSVINVPHLSCGNTVTVIRPIHSRERRALQFGILNLF